jgi:hypothetical protein
MFHESRRDGALTVEVAEVVVALKCIQVVKEASKASRPSL